MTFSTELDTKSRKKLEDEYSQAKEYLTKVAAAGAYVVSDDTAIALENLLHELDNFRHSDTVLEIDTHYGMVKECITKIRQYAKRDLHKR